MRDKDFNLNKLTLSLSVGGSYSSNNQLFDEVPLLEAANSAYFVSGSERFQCFSVQLKQSLFLLHNSVSYFFFLQSYFLVFAAIPKICSLKS